MIDPYKTLGIDRNASEEEIKKAYRKKAFENHPDRSPGDPEAEKRFKDVQTAYEMLTKKTTEPSFFDFDFFSQGFKAAVRRGEDVLSNCEISFRESYFGCKKTVEIKAPKSCDFCNGRGANLNDIVNCEMCHGQGSVSFRQGIVNVRSTCHACKGNGKIITNPCTECKGKGKILKSKTIETEIPAGVPNNSRIRLAGEGGSGDVPGDAYVHITVQPSDMFYREYDNLCLVVPVSYPEAVLGGEIEVPTFEGIQNVKVPANSKSGTTLKLKGLGFTNPNTKRKGDCLVKIEIDVNSNNKKEIENLLKKEKSNPSKSILDFKEKLDKFIQD